MILSGRIVATGIGGVASLASNEILVTQSAPPVPNQGGAIGSASVGAPTAGGGVALFGTGFSLDTNGALTTPLSGTLGVSNSMVNITGTGHSASSIRGSSAASTGPIAAPLFFVSPNQINFQMPWEFLGQSQVSLTVTAFGVTSPPITVNLANPSPAIYTINQAGTGQGAIQIANTPTFAAPTNSIPGAQASPVQVGQYITIYCTGFGDVTNRPADGAASLASPLSGTVLTTTATVGGINAPVSFSGLAPGFVALYQVNVQVPTGVTPGNAVQVILDVGGVASNTVTIAVQ